MNKTIIFFFQIVAFGSCINANKDCIKLHLSESSYGWDGSMSEGDTIFYQGNKGSIDTLWIFENRRYFDECNLMISDKVTEDYYFQGRLLNSLEEVKDKYVRFQFSAYEENEDSYSFSVYGTNKQTKSLESPLYYEHDTLVSDSYILNWTWNNSDGLVEYQKINGEIFKRIVE